ncbi:MAG: AzlD domain-containing protein [Clostridia bacterium]|nr:AzlD domain-containing protein [Clostridia bacterium]
MKLVWYLVVMAVVTYLIRAIPFTLFRSKVKSPFLQYFFAYIPYAVLAAMTIPHMLYEGGNPICAGVGLITAIVLAFFERSLITVAVAACAATFVAGFVV